MLLKLLFHENNYSAANTIRQETQSQRQKYRTRWKGCLRCALSLHPEHCWTWQAWQKLNKWSFWALAWNSCSKPLLSAQYPLCHWAASILNTTIQEHRGVLGGNLGCSESMRWRAFSMDVDIICVMPFGYRTGNWSLLCWLPVQTYSPNFQFVNKCSDQVAIQCWRWLCNSFKTCSTFHIVNSSPEKRKLISTSVHSPHPLRSTS